MKNFWEKIKNFFGKIWGGLTYIGRILLGLIALALIILIVFVSTNKEEDSETAETTATRPEIAQIFEPSIGTPLPADTPAGSGTVSGAITETPSTPQPSPTPTPANVMTATPQFVAPLAGINDADPIRYQNNDLKFSATLPAQTNVQERKDEVTFTSNKGTLLYTVSSITSGTETLESIEAQLRNSPSTSGISRSTFSGNSAITFSAKGYGTGIAIITKGTIYYILGNTGSIADFKIM